MKTDKFGYVFLLVCCPCEKGNRFSLVTLRTGVHTLLGVTRLISKEYNGVIQSI